MAENMENGPNKFFCEEIEAAQLAKVNRDNPFTVPSNYFEELKERTHHAVFLESLKNEKDCGFTVPENYFNTLENSINAEVGLEEFKDDKNQGFEVPNNYFETLQYQINTKIVKNGKTIKLWRQPFFKSAVAASIIIAATGGWLITDQTNKQISSNVLTNDQMLYDIDQSVIEEYIHESQNAKTTKATVVELEAYILDNFSTNELSNNL